MTGSPSHQGPPGGTSAGFLDGLRWCGCVEDELHSLVRAVPNREVTACGEPLQPGRRKRLLSASGLPRQAQMVLAAPANDERTGGIGRRSLLLGACRKIAHEGIEGLRARKALQFGGDDLPVQAPRPGGKLRQKRAAHHRGACEPRQRRTQSTDETDRCPERGAEVGALPTSWRVSRRSVWSGIALRVVVLGLAVAFRRNIPTAAAKAPVGVFAIFRGHARRGPRDPRTPADWAPRPASCSRLRSCMRSASVRAWQSACPASALALASRRRREARATRMPWSPAPTRRHTGRRRGDRVHVAARPRCG